MKKTIAEMEQTAASEAANKLISLFDEDSFVELGKFVGANGEKTGVVSGYGYVDGAVVYAYAQDTSVNAGAVNTAAALKIKKVYELALKNGAPVIGIFDSKGGDIKEGMKTLGAYGEIAKMSAALSGAGTAENAAKSGVAAILAKDSEEAIAKAKQLLSVLPANNLETAGNDYYMENDAAVSADLKGIELISSVADKESVIELYKQFGTSAVTAIGSLNWRTAGFVATNNGAKLTADDSAKIARFVTLCDAYSIPVVTFVDSEGFEKSSAAELAGSIRDSAKLAQAYASATTAKIAVVTGKAYGSAYVALASTAAGSDFTFAWEGAVIAPTTPEAAVVFLNGVSEDNAKQAQEYADNEADAFTAAANGYVDRVITAEDTKSALTSAIEATSSKRVVTPAKKHVNFVY